MIVTGAGRGVGQGIALCMAEEGASVVIATLEAEEGKRTEDMIRKAGGSAYFIQTDVSSESSIVSMIAQTVSHYGKINSLVNNAGITLFKPILEATLEDWDNVINIDLRGTFLCVKYAVPEMKKQNNASVINISSNHALATLPDTEMYAAAKGGVNAMTRSMALSLGKYGIRVNAICPGFTDTPHYRNWLQQSGNPHETEREVVGLHAGSAIGTPEDIGRLAVYLASEQSRMMTGAELVVDGGLSARLYHSKLC